MTATPVTLLTDESLRKRLGNAGYARWRTRFSYARFQARLEEILQPLRSGDPSLRHG